MSKKQIETLNEYTSIFGENSDNSSVDNIDPKLKRKLECALKIALDTRKFEIEMYWKRANHFWLFVAAIFVAWGVLIANPKIESYPVFNFMLISLGIIVSFCWYCVNRASKFWQENWENNISYLSAKLQMPIFDIILNSNKKWSSLTSHYAYSVSKVNQMVSLIVTIFWIALGCFEVTKKLFCEKECHWICYVGAIAICLIVIWAALYIIHHNVKSFVATEGIGDGKFFYNNVIDE